ncbi:MAG: hypothetical protein WD066_04225 [Planctomycetaceae bacterium]
MKCTTFARELRSVKHGRGDLPPRLERHAAACARCRRMWEDRLLLDTAVVRWRSRVPNVNLADDVLAAAKIRPLSSALARGAADGPPPSPPGGTGAIAVALLALLLAAAALMLPTPTRRPPNVASSMRSVSEGEAANAVVAPSESRIAATTAPEATGGRSASSGRRAGALALVAGIGEFVPGPWELASVLDDGAEWPADPAGWLDPWSLLPAPE